jgi:multicomponent Na+:H+ antiporter subunit E
MVSLTPGTLSLDVSEDQCVLFVHSMYAPDPEKTRKEIKDGFERRVLALTHGKEFAVGKKENS